MAWQKCLFSKCIFKSATFQIVVYVFAIGLFSMLNALVDLFHHPEIPFFDDEHLIVGGVSGVAIALLFGAVIYYTRQTEQANAVLRLREKQLAESQRNAHIGSWDLELATGKVILSKELIYLLGLDPQKDQAGVQMFFDMVHPDDYPALHKVIDEVAKAAGQQFGIDCRFLLKDGTARIMHFHVGLKHDEAGTKTSLSGTLQDVTDRKMAENKLSNAISKVKLLTGMLPICSSCKKIRDDHGYWRQIESYIHAHSEAEFTHGICPDCSKKVFPAYRHEMKPDGQQANIPGNDI